MINKLSKLSIFYVVAVIFAALFPFINNAQINGSELSFIQMSLFGFLAGMALEGVLLIITATFVILFTDKLD